jgi:outer membrane protein TolC
LALALAAAPAIRAGEAVDTLSLARCVDIALHYNPLVRSAQGSSLAGEAAYHGARANLLPQVNAAASGKAFGGDVSSTGGFAAGSGNATGQLYSAGVAAQQLLFDFGKTPARSASAYDQWQAARTDAEGTLESVAMNAQLAFINYLLSLAVKQVDEEALNQATAHLNLSQVQFEAGRGTRFNVSQAEVVVANAQLNFIHGKNQILLGRSQLENALGRRLADSLVVLDSLTAAPRDIDMRAEVAAALAHRPELVAAKLRQESSREQVRAAQGSRLPDLTGTAGYGGQSSHLDSQWDKGWNVGVGLTLPIFAGGALQAGVDQARGALQQSEAFTASLEQAVVQEVEQDVLNLREDAERMQVASKAVASAQLALDLSEERFRQGVGQALEVIDSELGIANARIQTVQAVSDYRTSEVRLLRATGRLELPSAAR